tara:strand:+ start:1351 stop:1455 length:105 start_codon:yes stop_codon:yes gene_type:complete
MKTITACPMTTVKMTFFFNDIETNAALHSEVKES